MVRKKTLLVLLSLVIASVLLTACTGKTGDTSPKPTVLASPEPDGIRGKWLHPDMGYQKGVASVSGVTSPVVYEFTQDGKILMDFDGKSFTELAKDNMTAIGLPEKQMNAALQEIPEMSYTIENDKIIILTKTGSETSENSGKFKLEGDTLTLPDFGADTLILTRVK